MYCSKILSKSIVNDIYSKKSIKSLTHICLFEYEFGGIYIYKF